MHKLITIFILTYISHLGYSQNIYTALQLNQEREYNSKKPKKIVEFKIFYNISSTQINKNVKTFDEVGMLLIEERYDENGTLKARLTYTNDTTNRLILTRTLESWNTYGFSKETAFYNYDSNHFLISAIDKDSYGNIYRQSDFVCNEKGQPIKLSLYDGSRNLIGIEVATYMHEINKVITSVISNDGDTLSTSTIKISFTKASLNPNKGEIYNTNGDLTNWTSKNFSGEETIFEEEYNYDGFGNCIENKIFKVKIKRNGNKKRSIDRVFKKEYTY